MPVDQNAKLGSVSNRFGPGQRTTATAKITTVGDTTVHTPPVNKLLVVYWVGMSSSQGNPGETEVLVKLGGVVVYDWFMGNPGAFSHWEAVQMNINDSLVVNLSNGSNPVAFNYTYSEL